MKKKMQLYLVGNAHLDPVWQWRWQEGSAEAKATIRSALDRMKEFPDFKFVCSSASVFRWIEEFDESMFNEIKERVKEGRFVIVGGWHVQPDCNLPSGEGFARQSLYSQRYFKEKFGVTATVGYNVDSFGHNAMLPQILRKSGMKYYLFMRPSPSENPLKSDIFNWKSADGSSVLTYRILDPYCFKFEDDEQLKARIKYLDESTSTDIDAIPFFYGVGNHGGGPTIRHIELLNAFKAANPEYEVHFSALSDFYDRVISDGYSIPDYTGDLQHHAAGCYSTVSHIKKGIRESEFALTAAESYDLLASKLCGKKGCPNEKLAEAWRNICFLHFHDIFDGCCIKEACEDAKYIYGSSLCTAAVTENNALQTISWAVSTIEDKEKGLPVFLFNPHSFPVRRVVQINKTAQGVCNENGNELPWQLVHSTTEECYSRSDIIFTAEVPALGYSVYYIKDGSTTASPNTLKCASEEKSDVLTVNENAWRWAYGYPDVVLENEYYVIKFERYSGYIISFFDKKAGKELICGKSAVPVVIDEYAHDTWSHAKNFFTDECGRFGDAEVTVLENGPVRATVKVISRYGSSVMTQYFSLASHSDKLEVRTSVDWHEKHKMLKQKWCFDIKNPKAVYEIPFGVIERPADGEEEPGLTWFGAIGDENGFVICNNGTYSSSVKDGTLYHTLLRSPIYGDHGGKRSSESDYTDQGVTELEYVVMPFNGSNAEAIKTARLLNKPITAIVENWHEGKLSEKRFAALNVSVDNVIVSAVKRSEDGTGTVIRIYETDGKKTSVTVSGVILPAPLTVEITPYSVETFFLKDESTEWKNVLITEYDFND